MYILSRQSLLLVQDGGRVGVLLLLGRLPEYNAVLTGLGESEIPKPPDTIHVVAVDISCGEGGEVHQDHRKTPEDIPEPQ